MSSPFQQIPLRSSAPRAAIGLLALSLAAALAGCGGGESVTEAVEPQKHPATFDLTVAARAVLTEPAAYEARTVSGGTAAGSLRLSIQPSVERVAAANSSELEPESVTWTTALRWDGFSAGATAVTWSAVLAYANGLNATSYDRQTGQVSFGSGTIDNHPFLARRYRFPTPVLAGAWIGEPTAPLASPVEIFDTAGTELIAVATYGTRLTPTGTANPPDEAWFCVEKNYYEPAKFAQQPNAAYSYCWLIGVDGRPKGPFKATVADGDDSFSFEGRRL